MEGNEFCSEAQGLKKFESNKNAISPNVLFSSSNNKEMKLYVCRSHNCY